MSPNNSVACLVIPTVAISPSIDTHSCFSSVSHFFFSSLLFLLLLFPTFNLKHTKPHLFSGTAEQHMSGASTTETQKNILERFFFEQGTAPDEVQLSKLAASSEMEELEVKQWFVRKRKREKKKRNQANQKKKKKNKTTTASSPASKSNDSFMGKYTTTTTKPLPIFDAAALHEEIKLTTQQLTTDGNNSELYYRRGSALISLGRDLSNPSSWGNVSDETSWNQGLEDLERAHRLRYSVQ